MRYLVITLAVLVGCGLSEDPPVGHPDLGPTRSDGLPVTKLQKPMVDPPPQTVCGTSVPIQGTARPGVSVFAVGGAETSGVTADANSVTGRFCLDVRLQVGAANVIEVRAQDPLLGTSDPVTVTVQQSSCKDDVPPPVDPVKPQNVALGILARASKAPDEGNEGFLTDGKAATVVKYSGGWGTADADVWVTLKLEKLTEVGSVVVRWRDSSGAGEQYATSYKVLVSSISDPGDPNLKNGYWNVVASYTAGNGGVDTVDLKTSKPVVQHVALWLLQDGASWSWAESFAIGELEVWNIPKQTTPTPISPTKTCADVGLGS